MGKPTEEGDSTKKEVRDKKTLELCLNDKDKKDILLKRYDVSFSEMRSGVSNVWKSTTIVTGAVPILVGSSEYLKIEKWTPFVIAVLFWFVGLVILIRERIAFSEYIGIMARIERILGLHEEYAQFKDGRLLPEGYIKAADYTYKDLRHRLLTKKMSLFFAFLILYVCLIVVLLLWAFLPVPTSTS